MKPQTLVDIIIPTYENEKLTVNCFKSIKKNTTSGDYRIIWVDNNSKNYKKALKTLNGLDYKFIRLEKNEGFVGAINRGLVASNSKIVCLLNNDTEVTPKWLDKLVSKLYSAKDIGIVGPLTGPVIKERYDSHHCITYHEKYRVIPKFPKFKNFEDFNKKIERKFSYIPLVEIDFVAFLCAVIKREVINKVGLLDEGYDFGMWDDLDYNRWAKRAGYRVGLSFDTCIYHKGRGTFNLIQEKENFDVPSLLLKNKKYLDEKWAALQRNTKNV